MAILLEIKPHIGIGNIKLGSTRTEAKQLAESMGFSLESSNDTLDYFCDSSIQLEFGESGLLQYIGLTYHDSYQALYEGVNVFDTEANTLFKIINKKEVTPSLFNDYEHVFPTQIISLWDSDSQYDRYQNESRCIWASVGVGDENYLKASEAIENGSA